jgi:Holliday junction DNA helicase RuvA
MYEYLHGRLVSKSLTGAVIDVAGMGFSVEISLRTAEKLPAIGTAVKLFVHLRPQEDRFRLFGFVDAEERELFREVQTVAGIGPATALALLAGHEPQEIWRLLREGEWKALARTKGIGPKIAQRACTELKERASRFALQSAAPQASGDGARLADAVSALLVLGYSEAQAHQAVETAARSVSAQAPLEDLVREALKHA